MTAEFHSRYEVVLRNENIKNSTGMVGGSSRNSNYRILEGRMAYRTISEAAAHARIG